MAARTNKSEVWKSFTKVASNKVRCNFCSKELAVTGGQTSSLHSHLRSKHPGESAQSCATPTITSFTTPRHCTDSRKEKITTAIGKVIVENMLPISFVESESMHELLALLEPGYQLPCRQTMTDRLDRQKSDVAEKVKADLTAAQHVSVTTDIWTSVSNDAYLSFTASYIDGNWKVKTPVLATMFMEERHTQAVITESLGHVADEWQLNDKIVACVHDGAANIRDAGARNKWSDVHCSVHKLQLCITSAMGVDKVTSNPIAKCIGAASRLVGHFSHSPMAVGELRKRQASMFPDSQPKKLIQHCKTRWNSAYDMFERLVELRWPVCAVLSDRNVVKPADAKTLELKDENWQLMSDLLPVLKPLKIATCVLSAEKEPTSSKVYPMLSGLVDDHLGVSDDDASTVSTFKAAVVDSIKQRFGMTDLATTCSPLVIASVLDPTVKDLSGSC